MTKSLDIKENIEDLRQRLPSGVKLVAVSKFHPSSAIEEAYAAGQRCFAESRPQELFRKIGELEGKCPEIEWQFIGHLQTNKLKLVLPYVSLVQSVDSVKLLLEIDRWGKAAGKTTDILLEMHIAGEDSKQGFFEEEALELLFNAGKYANIRFRGLMGMASNVDDEEIVLSDFRRIADFKDYVCDLFPELEAFDILSIGMSGDWPLALQAGSNMVRIGSAIFGERS